MRDVVLIGTGGFGRCWWPALADRPDTLRVVAVVEPDPVERDLARDRFGLPADRAAAALGPGLAGLGACLAIDSSPFPHRRANAEWVFAAGMDLLAAKPLSGSLADATAIADAAGAAGRGLAVAQQMRYFPCFLALRAALRDRTHGAPLAVDVRMALDGRGWTPGTAWRLAMRHPLLLEAGIHHVDLLRWCLSDELDWISPVAWNPPWSPFRGAATVAATMRTVGGVPITYAATFAPAPGQEPVRFDSGWRVVCERGVLTVVDGGLFVDGAPTDVPATAEPVGLEKLNDLLLTDWLTALDQGGEPAFSGADNLRGMTVLDQAIRAVERGTPG